MTPAQAAPDLERRLLALGFDFSRPSLQLALKAFRGHLSVPMEGVSDYVMVDVGTNDFEFQPIRPALTIDLTRQFGHFEDGEFSHYEQLHLMLYAPAKPEFYELQMSEFCDDGEERVSFLNAVGADRAIVAARSIEFAACLLKQWDV
ncbi:MAG: hypothetical protein KF686_18835 [Ramlibacter sp.]|nr:hypothetical protein [Ramlibacter sp.]